MQSSGHEPLWKLLGVLFKPHPWHGIEIGPDWPETVNSFIEIVPTDTVKYEIDKITGHLTVDRPQLYSNVCPTLYGFIPQTYCGERVAAASNGERLVADGDPLDICVLTEKTIMHGNILLQAVPIGGLRMIDGGEVDDKIVAVLRGDLNYGRWRTIEDCPEPVINRLKHYFLTYKDAPGADKRSCHISHVYGRAEAHNVIRRSREDYTSQFGNLEELLTAALRSEDR